MDAGRLQNRRIGSVKSVISSCGERTIDGSSATKKLQKDYSEKQYPSAGELCQAKRDTDQFNESRRLAESVTAQAESELSGKDLTLAIEESSLSAKVLLGNLEKLKMRERIEEESKTGNSQNAEAMRELESVKQELSELKLDMASILEEKRRAEKETESCVLQLQSYSSSVESLAREIEEINEEHVLVELARIEAIKEYGAIEAQKREAAEKHSAAMEETRKKMNEMFREIENARELEAKLANTMSDINMLESLKEIKEMDRRLQIDECLTHHESRFQKGDEPESPHELQSVVEQLEAAKKELVSVKEESFQFMASMDVIRDELKHVAEETARIQKKEAKADAAIQSLNSKLLRAKAKLESMSAAEDKAKSIVSNLSLTLEQLKSEAEAAKKERSLISDETAIIKAEIQETETDIDLAEERLQVAIQELRAAKALETTALQKLKSVVEKTMRSRASASRYSSMITISKFEYKYLTGNASGAKEIADKKVAAAQAWIEALKASEKEILLKSSLARRETREVRAEEEREVDKTEKSLHEKKRVEEELQNRKQKYEQKLEQGSLQPEIALPRRSMNRSVKMTPARRAKPRKSASPIVRNMPRSTSFTVRGRRKVIPNLSKLFGGRNDEKNLKRPGMQKLFQQH